MITKWPICRGGEGAGLALVVLLLTVSGNPALNAVGVHPLLLLTTAGLLALLLLARRELQFTPRFTAVCLIMGGILLVHALEFSVFSIVTIGGYLVRLFVAYAVIRLVDDFPRVYVKAMSLLGILSLCFHVPDNVLGAAGVSLRSLLAPLSASLGNPQAVHVGLHNFTSSLGDLPYRNAGMFWEPGAFAGFLLLAIVFLALRREAFSGRAYKLHLLVLVACLLSTQSTTGYLVLPLALLLHAGPALRACRRPSDRYVRAYAMVAGLGLFALGAWQLGFMREKIDIQLAGVARQQRDWETYRFGSLLFDLEYIQRRPFMGWGLRDETRYMLHPGTTLGASHGNGMSDFVAKFGVLGFATVLACMWKGLLPLARRRAGTAVGVMLILLLILNGENFLDAPAFLALLFLELPPPAPVVLERRWAFATADLATQGR